jgi:hypothetical protein
MQSHTLIDFLTTGSQDAAEKKKYIASTHALLKELEYTRVFNNHVVRANQADYQHVRNLFFHDPLFGSPELRKVQTISAQNVSDRYEFIKEKDKERVLTFVNSIVVRACKELLDTQGHIKRQIVHLLDWSEFHTVIREKAVIAKIVRSYVEVIMSGLLQDVTRRMQNPETLLPVWGSITHVANESYAALINRNIKTLTIVEMMDDYAVKFVAALPKSVSATTIRAMVVRDLSHADNYPELKKAYTNFWIHVLSECLAVKRLGLISAIIGELEKTVILSSLSANLRDEYLFCLDRLSYALQVATVGLEMAASDRSQLVQAEEVLAQRNHFVTMQAIIAEYVATSPSMRSFKEADILKRLDQGVIKQGNGKALSLLERLQFAYKQCHMYGVEAGALAKIVAKYVVFFANRVSLELGEDPEQKRSASAAYSDAEMITQMGSRKSVVASAAASNRIDAPAQAEHEAVSLPRKKSQ